MKRVVQNVASIAALAVVWLVVSLIISDDFLFPTPRLILKEVGVYLVTPSFYAALFSTLVKVLISFLISLVAGVALAFLSYNVRWIRTVFYPLLVVMRAAPTMSVVFICLTWFSSRVSPVIVACLVIFPVLYSSALTGLEGVDGKLKEMSALYGVKKTDEVRYLYLPSLFERLYSDSVSTLSLNVKLVIAAEAWASQVNNNLGTLLTAAKGQLETAKLFAVTLLAVLLSFALELSLRGVKALVQAIRRKKCRSL